MAIHVGLSTLTVQVPASQSLKDKRQIIKSLLANLHNKFNLSAAEVDDLDRWQSSVIAMTCVANQSSHIDEVLNAALRFVESDPRLIVQSVETEHL